MKGLPSSKVPAEMNASPIIPDGPVKGPLCTGNQAIPNVWQNYVEGETPACATDASRPVPLSAAASTASAWHFSALVSTSRTCMPWCARKLSSSRAGEPLHIWKGMPGQPQAVPLPAWSRGHTPVRGFTASLRPAPKGPCPWQQLDWVAGAKPYRNPNASPNARRAARLHHVGRKTLPNLMQIMRGLCACSSSAGWATQRTPYPIKRNLEPTKPCKGPARACSSSTCTPATHLVQIGDGRARGRS